MTRACAAIAAGSAALYAAQSAYAATYTHTAALGGLDTSGSWVGTSGVPGSGDIGLFNSTITGAQSDTLGGTFTIGELQVTNVGGNISITGDTNTLTINGVLNPTTGAVVGIDMSAAAGNFSFASTDSVAIGAAQNWYVSSGKTLTISGNLTGSANLYIGNGTSTTAGTVLLNTTTDGYSGNIYASNGATLSVQSAQSSDSFVLNNGATLTTNQALTAYTNYVYANTGNSSYINTNSSGQALLAGNGNITFTISNGTTFMDNFFNSFGGVATWGNAGSFRLYNSANSYGQDITAPFATLNFGAGSGSIFARDSGETPDIIGAVEGTGASGFYDGTSNDTVTFYVGSANSNTTWSGSLVSSSSTTNFLKVGTGTLTFNGGTAFVAQGYIAADGGVLEVNEANMPTGLLNASSPLHLDGGQLYVLGKNSGTTTQTLGAVTIGAGGSSLVVDTNGGNSTTLTLGTLTATTAGGTLNIDPANVALSGSAGTITTTTDLTTTGTSAATSIYSPRLTYGSDWATGGTSGNSTLTNYSSYNVLSSGFVGGNNTTNDEITSSTGNVSLTGNYTANTLKINPASGQTLGLGGKTLILSAGGLLFTGNNNFAIGGSVGDGLLASNTATNSDLIIQQLGNGTLTINSVIANGTGASTLTQGGFGTVVLAAANTYTGSTYLNGGITAISADSNLGNATTGAALYINGGTLEPTGNVTLDNGGSNKRAVGIGGGGATFNTPTNVTLTIDGVVSNNVANEYGPLVKTGSGTLVLSGNNTYLGATIISAGILSVNTIGNGSNGTSTTSSALGGTSFTAGGLVINGGILQYTGTGNSTNRTFTVGTNGATIDNEGSGPLNFTSFLAGLYPGAGSLTFDGASASGTNVFNGQIIDGSSPTAVNINTTSATGVSTTSTWQFTGASTYSGVTTVNGGTLNVANTSGSATGSGNVTLAAGTLSGNGAIAGTVNMNGGTLAPGAAGTNLTVGGLAYNSGNFSFSLNGNSSSQISAGNVTFNAALTAGNLSFSGILTLANGDQEVLINSSNPITNVTDATGITENFGRITLTTAAINSNDTIVLNVTGNPANLIWAGNATGVSGSGGNGTTWNNTQNNGGNNWNNGGAYDYFYDADNVTFNDQGAPNYSVNLSTVNSPASVTVNTGNTYTFGGSGSIAGVGNLSVVAGTLQLNTSNTYSGATTISSAGTLSLGGTIGSGAGTAISTAGTFNESSTGVIAGGSSLLNTGNATLAGVNSYSGSTTVSGGALNIQNNSALGTGTGNTTSGVTVATGAALQMQGNISTTTAVPLTLNGTGVTGNGALENVSGANTYSGLITLAGNTTIGSDAGTLAITNPGTITGSGFNLTLVGSGNGSIASIIGTGAGTVTMNGAGTWTLSGNNTFTGSTVISSGTLQLGAALALQNSTLNFNNQGGTLSFGSLTAATLGGLTGSQNLALNNGSAAVALTVGNNNGNTTYSGNLSGNGSLAKAGTGTLILSGNNSFTGSTTVSVGTLTITGSNSGNGSYSVSSVGTLTIGSGAGTVSASSVTLANGGNGVLNLNGGVLLLGSGGMPFSTFSANAALNFNGGTLKSSAAIAITTGGLPINILAGGATIDSSGGNITFGSGLAYATGSGNLTIQGGNTVSVGLTATNETGTVTVTGSGTKLTLNAASGTTSAGLLTINTGATVDMGNNTFTTGGLTGAGTLTDSGASKVFSITGNGSDSFGGNITGNTALTVNMTGAGTQILSGNNSNTGTTTVSTGTLQYQNSAAMSSSSQLTMNNGSTVQLRADGNQTFTTSVFNPSGNSAVTLDVGPISGSGNNTLTLNSTAAVGAGGATNSTMTFNVTGNSSDQLMIAGGNLSLQDNAGQTLVLNPTTANLIVASNLLNVNGSADTNGLLTLSGNSSNNIFSGNITNGSGGTVSVTKINTSTWTLSGNNSYTGNTTISAGTLFVSNTSGSGTGTGSVTVAATTITGNSGNYTGGTLGGSGNISGAVTLSGNNTPTHGGIITAGTSAAPATFTTGNQTWNKGAAYEWHITNSGSIAVGSALSANATNDVLQIGTTSSGTLSVSGDSTDPFTIAPLGNLTSSITLGGSNAYNWELAQIGTGNATQITINGNTTSAGSTNLLASTSAFALDTSGLSVGSNNTQFLSASNFSLYFETISGNNDLVLDYNGAPEPGTAMLVLGGAVPMLMGRRRRRRGIPVSTQL